MVLVWKSVSSNLECNHTSEFNSGQETVLSKNNMVLIKSTAYILNSIQKNFQPEIVYVSQ